jgi:hypothetical protein
MACMGNLNQTNASLSEQCSLTNCSFKPNQQHIYICILVYYVFIGKYIHFMVIYKSMHI